MQDETLGYLGDDALAAAAGEVLAGKLLTHSLRPCPRRVVVDATGCCGGACRSSHAEHAPGLGPHPMQCCAELRGVA